VDSGDLCAHAYYYCCCCCCCYYYYSRIDYCIAIYAGTPKTVTDKLQQVLNADARVVSDTKKYDRGLSTLLHDELHWLDVSERATYKLCVMMYRCLYGQAPRYLADHLTPASGIASRLRLHAPQTDISSLFEIMTVQIRSLN